MTGLGSSHFARRYSENHCCFLFLRLLRCFSSPRSPRKPMYSVCDVPALPGTGFPIQKSPDQCLFSSSPKLIAAYHVFHRLLTPRHPPPALNSLATKLLTQAFSCTFLPELSKNYNPKTIRPIHPANPLGGGERDRTDDLLRARQALSQLSYTPASLRLCGGPGWT